MATLAVWLAQYEDNLDYERSGNPTKALLYVEACRALLVKLPSEADERGGGSGNRYKLMLEALPGQIEQALNWLAANPPSDASVPGSVIYPSFENFRDAR